MSKANFMTIDPVLFKAFTKSETVPSFHQPQENRHSGTFVLNFVAIRLMFVEIFQPEQTKRPTLPSLDPNCLCNGMHVALKNDEQNPTKFRI